MTGENTKQKTENDENNQRNGDESEATLECRDLSGSREDASRPGEPGSISKDGDGNREQKYLGRDASPPCGRGAAVEPDKDESCRGNDGASKKNLPASAGRDECNERFELRWATEKSASAGMENCKAVKHGTEPSGRRKDMNCGESGVCEFVNQNLGSDALKDPQSACR
jgi:hypothetical protein